MDCKKEHLQTKALVKRKQQAKRRERNRERWEWHSLTRKENAVEGDHLNIQIQALYLQRDQWYRTKSEILLSFVSLVPTPPFSSLNNAQLIQVLLRWNAAHVIWKICWSYFVFHRRPNEQGHQAFRTFVQLWFKGGFQAYYFQGQQLPEKHLCNCYQVT